MKAYFILGHDLAIIVEVLSLILGAIDLLLGLFDGKAQHKRGKRLALLVCVLSATTLFIGFNARGFTAAYTRVPNLEGLRFAEAEYQAAKASLAFRYDDVQERDRRVRIQYPRAGMIVPCGACVYPEDSEMIDREFLPGMEDITNASVIARMGLAPDSHVRFYGWRWNARLYGTIRYTDALGEICVANVEAGRVNRCYVASGWYDGRLSGGKKTGLVRQREIGGNLLTVIWYSAREPMLELL